MIINNVTSQKLILTNAHKAGRYMEDNNPDTTAELAYLAAVLALEPKKPELTTSEATQRWIDTFSDCA